MKLRTQLILAFLLLSVLPLAGVTLYSYRSSISAFRDAVEVEAASMTEEMSERMELVTEDLSRRMERLETLPYETLLAKNPPSTGRGPQADRFVRRLKSEMGEAAQLIESLQYTPAPAAPRAPKPPQATARVIASDSEREFEIESDEPIVIHLNSLLFDSEETEDTEGAPRGTRVIQSGNSWMVIPEEVEGMEELVSPGLLQSLKVFVDDEQAVAVIEQVTRSVERQRIAGRTVATMERLAERRQQLEQHREHQMLERDAAFEQASERWSEAFEQATVDWDGDPEQMSQIMNQEGVAVAVKQMAEAASMRVPRFKLGRKFGCEVRQDGETVGQVTAQLNASEVLRSVLSETHREQGEISFAIGSDGSIYTPDPEDQKQLEQLGLGDVVAAGQPGTPTQLGDNWIVQTRQVPEMDLVFGIARPVGESLGTIRRTAGRNMGVGLGIVFFAMLGIVPLSGRMTRNLSRLTEGAEQLAQGNLEVRVPISSRDEIGVLAQTFNRMGADLRKNQQQLVHQERLKKELEMCRQIQDEMLPQGRLSFPFAEVRAVSIPAREVGGDFFNYFALPDGEIALLMGDVSGKGVPAAMMMANLQATLRARLPLEPDLAELARQLDLEIEQNTPPETYVTLFMGILDTKRQVLRYVNAGHNTQYLIGRDDAPRRLESSGRPLGLYSGGSYTERECALQTGDLLFLFTDGLVEAAAEDGTEFGEKRLEQLLLGERGHGPDSILEDVEQTIQRFRGSAEPADDATLLVLRFDNDNEKPA